MVTVITLLMLLTILCTGCGKEVKPETFKESNTIEQVIKEKEFCYNVSVGNYELNFLDTPRIHSVSITTDKEMYELFAEYPILSYDKEEVWFVDTLPDELQHLNHFSFGNIIAVTSSESLDLPFLSDYLLSDATTVTKIPVTTAELDPTIYQEDYRELFPDFDNESVISFALVEIYEDWLAVVQQVDEGTTVSYQYLGLDDHECRVTILNKLIIEDLDIIIDIKFQDNPKYKFTGP